MFLASSPKPIDPQLQKLVDEIEAQSPDLSVLSARQFRYSLYQTLLEVTISEPRKFNVLEEFILRAGVEIDPPPTEDELAAVLGLDPVFVQSTATTLRKLQTLAQARKSQIIVTPQGHQLYQQGAVPQPPYSVRIYAVADPLLDNLTFHSEPLDVNLVNHPDLTFVAIENRILDVSSLPLEEIQQRLQTSDLGLHIPEEGKIVTSYSIAAPPQTIWKAMSLFVLFDVLEDKVRLQVRRGKQILEDASNWLEALFSEGKVSLQALCEISEETAFECEAINQKNVEVAARIDKIRQQVFSKVKQDNQQRVSVEHADVVLLRDRQIRQTFLETLNSARSNILLYSPWLSEKVIDDEFSQLLQELAQREVFVLIGYGISDGEENKKWSILPEVRTPDGLPAIHICHLGNSHAQEVIVDRQVYLCGHNWFYHGDWLPTTGEVYQITNPDIVQEAFEDMARRFQSRAQQLWDDAVQNRNSQLAEVPISLWGVLSLEEMALTQLQQNNFLELLPVWLKVALHGLRAGTLSPNSANFATALSLLSQISEAAPYIDSLQKEWYQVIDAIASHKPDTALALITDEAWLQLTRLNIVQPPIESPEQLISKYTDAQKHPAKASQRKRTNVSNRKPKAKK